MLVVLAVAAVAVALFVVSVHPFLAVTHRVDADVLVVEGWIYEYMIPACVEEFRRGGYDVLMTSGMLWGEAERSRHGGLASDADLTAARLVAGGVPEAAVILAPSEAVEWGRTAAMARAVRAKIGAMGRRPRGVNVAATGPHARQTWVAYDRMLGPIAPVGIVSIPKNTYPADRWWTSRQGLIWVPKDFLGWVKELLIGQRS
jgi:hypothetical protein